MKKGKRIEAELELPEEIIQHIQSFLDGKEAAQTTPLSRTWYNAWLTRPNLDFDQKLFATKSDDDTENSFWESVNRTVERYEKFNITIDSLKLWIDAEHSLVNKLIIKALKAGATGLDFKIYNETSDFALAHQVLGFENLTRLSVRGCKIGEADGRVSCYRLKSLALDKVYPQGTIIWDIIWSCPLIENLSLSPICNMRALAEFGKQEAPILLNEFHKLKRLLLCLVRVHPSYFNNFSSKFPCLEDLNLDNCAGCTDLQISSPSLKCIDITGLYFEIRRMKFDVPRIRKFTFLGSSIPLLLFKTNTSNWESDIHIRRHCAPCATWFLKLSRFLKKLSSSQISLYLSVWSERPSEYVGVYHGLRNKPKVGYLRINGAYAAFPAFYYSLFKCCRPMVIEYIWIPRHLRKEGDVVGIAWERKMQQVCLDSCIEYQRTTSECDLEEVCVEFYDESISEWTISTSLGPADAKTSFLMLGWGC